MSRKTRSTGRFPPIHAARPELRGLKADRAEIRKSAEMALKRLATQGYTLDPSIRFPTGPNVLDAEPEPLPAPLRDRLIAIGRPASEVEALRHIRLQGDYGRVVGPEDFVSDREGVLLVIGPDFNTEGSVTASGPIVCVGDAHFRGPLTSSKWILFDDESIPGGPVHATEIYVAPNANTFQATLRSQTIRV